MKKRTALLLSCIMTAAVLAGCGGTGSAKKSDTANYNASDYDSDDMYLAEEAAAPAEAYEADTTYGDNGGNGDNGIDDSSVAKSSRKIIKTVNINAETEEFDSFIANVTAKVNSLGGYMERSEVSGRSISDAKAQKRNAYLVARIPANNLDSFISLVSETSNITNKNESAEDVTLSYADTEAHIESLRAEQKRLNELLLQAEDIETIIVIESRLTDVRYELESYESRLRTIDNQVDYSTVYIEVREVERYTVVEEPEETVGSRISKGFSENLSKAGDKLVDFFVGIIVGLPTFLLAIFFLAIPAAIAFLIWKLVLRIIWGKDYKEYLKKNKERRKEIAKAKKAAKMAGVPYIPAGYQKPNAYMNAQQAPVNQAPVNQTPVNQTQNLAENETNNEDINVNQNEAASNDEINEGTKDAE